MYIHCTKVTNWQRPCAKSPGSKTLGDSDTAGSPRRRRTNSSSSRARKTGAQLRDNRRSAKKDAKCVKKPFTAPNCHRTLSMTESEAPPVLSARTGMSTTLSVNATAALSGPWATVVHNKRQQPCSGTALWNLSSVAQLEGPALCR